MGERTLKDKRKSKVDTWLEPDNLLLLECWTRDGYTNTEVAEKVGVTESTLWSWRNVYPQIEEAMKKGREVIDYKVENALLKSALGYTVEEVKTIISDKVDKNGNRPVRVEKTVKEIAPNTTAIAIWLNNRKPDQWKRNRDNQLDFKDTDNNITVNIIKHDSKNKKEAEEEWTAEIEEESNNKESNNTKHKSNSKSKKRNKRKEIKETKEAEEEWPEGDWDE